MNDPEVQNVEELVGPPKINIEPAMLDNQPEIISNSKISDMHSAIDRMQTVFALKLVAKDLLSQNLVSEIITFCNDVHDSKMDLIAQQLKRKCSEDSVSIHNVLKKIKLVDHSTGLKQELSTPYRRTQYFKRKWQFIDPQRTPIGPNEESFYYLFSVKSTLSRLLNDDSVRSHIINQPLFTIDKV